MRLNRYNIIRDYKNDRVSTDNSYTQNELWGLYALSVNLGLLDTLYDSKIKKLADVGKSYIEQYFRIKCPRHIELHGKMFRGLYDVPMYVFKIDDQYVCNMSELKYCPDELNYYCLLNTLRLYYKNHYIITPILNDNVLQFKTYLDLYGTIVLSGAINYDPLLMSSVRFTCEEDANRASKLAKNNRSLFNKLYSSHNAK